MTRGPVPFLPLPLLLFCQMALGHEIRPAIADLVIAEDGQYRLDLDGLAAVAAEPANRLLILCSPHNPTGSIMTREDMEAVAEIVAAPELAAVTVVRATPPNRPRDPSSFASTWASPGRRWAAGTASAARARCI